MRRRRKRAGETRTPAEMPREIVERVERIREYHASTLHTYESVRLNPNKLDWSTRPSPFREFPDHPKVDLPSDLIDADAPALTVLSQGLSGLPDDATHPPQDLRTLASWLKLANGVTEERKVGKQKVALRSCPSSSAVFPFEIYVAAFGVRGLEPGLYHYDCKASALRKLRDGDTTLARIKKGRPDLEFLKTVPAALLVSTIYCRSTWRYRQRGYRYALLDAGHLVQNLVTAANGLGFQTTTRLSMNDRNTRELIGIPADAPFREAESVQAMVVWAENAAEPIAVKTNGTPVPADSPPPIPRQPLAAEVTAYEQILMVHEDCVAPGVALRELRPPLTELSPRKKGRPPTVLPAPAEAAGGPPLANVMTKRRSAPDFRRASIPLDQLWTVSRLAFRGGSYFPVFPSGPHVGLIRPMWIIGDVDGLEPGVWNYDPIDDHWTLHKPGVDRFEQQYLCLEQAICGNASAVCFMLADLKVLMDRGGPDTYRLAHLEAGIAGQRMFLASHALGVGCTGIGPVYDAETLSFLDPDPSGWEVIYSAVLGETKEPERAKS
jgi:SagB-type dehydrogenase family enzyme